MPRTITPAFAFRAGVSIDPEPVPADIATALASDPSIPSGAFLVLCDGREFGENFGDPLAAGAAAARTSAAFPSATYTVVRVSEQPPAPDHWVLHAAAGARIDALTEEVRDGRNVDAIDLLADAPTILSNAMLDTLAWLDTLSNVPLDSAKDRLRKALAEVAHLGDA